MSMGATMSILGLWNNDHSIFDLLQLPEGFTTEDRETVTDSILIECAELEVLYAAPAVMKNCIGIWSRKELPVWQRIYNASLLEYNPIENYRRDETETIADARKEEHSGTDTNTASGTDTTTASGTDTNTASGTDTTTASGTDTNTASGTDTNSASGTDSTLGNSSRTTTDGGTDVTKNDVTGFDSNAMVPSNQQTVEHGMTQGVTENASNSTTYGRTDTVTHGRVDSFQHGKVEALQHGKVEEFQHGKVEALQHGKVEAFQHGETIEHSGGTTRTNLAFGNIGVTTSQQMLTQEIEIAKIINVIPYIVDSFKNRFCILVY